MPIISSGPLRGVGRDPRTVSSPAGRCRRWAHGVRRTDRRPPPAPGGAHVPETPDASVTRAALRRTARAVRWRARRAQAALALKLAPDSFVPQMAAARIPVDAEVAVYYADS